jgi:hypothetical protein
VVIFNIGKQEHAMNGSGEKMRSREGGKEGEEGFNRMVRRTRQ